MAWCSHSFGLALEHLWLPGVEYLLLRSLVLLGRSWDGSCSDWTQTSDAELNDHEVGTQSSFSREDDLPSRAVPSRAQSRDPPSHGSFCALKQSGPCAARCSGFAETSIASPHPWLSPLVRISS